MPIEKKNQRSTLANERRQIAVDIKAQLDADLNGYLIEQFTNVLNRRAYPTVALYMPIKGEPDLWPLILWLYNDGRLVYLPKVIQKDHELGFYQLMAKRQNESCNQSLSGGGGGGNPKTKDLTNIDTNAKANINANVNTNVKANANIQPFMIEDWRLTRSKMNIIEPDDNCAPLLPTQAPSCMIIPCLGFNSTRHRLGYGGGYYDRTLSAYQKLGLKLITIGVGYQIGLTEFSLEPHDIAMDHLVISNTPITHTSCPGFQNSPKPFNIQHWT